MVPNHDGDQLRSILGPMGSHWVKKIGSKPQEITMPQISNFPLPCGHRFFAKNGSKGYGAKSWWGHPRVHFGANGVPLGKKNGSNRKKLPYPKIRIFDYHADIDFSLKMEVTVMAPNQGGDPLGSILGPMGSHWVKKWVKTVKNYRASKFEFSTTPRSSIFRKKNGSCSYGVKSRWGPPRVHLWAKNGSKRKKLPCPNIRIFDD